MAVQLSTSVRNARIDVVESTVGASARLRLLSGSPPANCAAADSGTLLATLVLPASWLDPASGGSANKAGTWSGTIGTGGTIGYWRIYDPTETTCHAQGTVTLTGGGGDLESDAVVVTAGQTVTVTSFSLTDANS